MWKSQNIGKLKAQLFESINPEVRKGRLYKLTDKGEKLVKNINPNLGID